MSSELDDRLNDWFDSVSPRALPPDILQLALREARTSRQQRAAWHRLVATIESAWTARTPLAPRLGLAAVALLVTVALAGAAVAAGLISLPSPPPVVDGLIAVQDQFGEVPEGQLPAYVIRLIDPQTGQDAFTTPADVEACGAHFSPDGSQYAFLQRADAGGGFDVAVAPASADFHPTLLLHKPEQAYFDPSWAPDGSSLAMTVEAEALDAGYRELWVVPVDGTPARRLTDIQTSYSADWSSSGDWIAFVGVGADHPLYIVRPDGTDLRMLRSSGADSVAWSPLRDELAYTASDGELHVVGVDGRELFTAGDGRDPATIGQFPAGSLVPVWSPDATRIALVSDGVLRSFDVASGSMTRITTPAPVSRPVWSANGRTMIAVAEDGDLWELTVDGAAPRLIADGTQAWCMSASRALSWQRLRP